MCYIKLFYKVQVSVSVGSIAKKKLESDVASDPDSIEVSRP